MANTNTQHDDEKLDETLDESFPASDPPANTVEIGIRTGESRSSDRANRAAPGEEPDVSDNRARSRFELTVEGHTAFLAYEQTNDTFTILHTEVPTPLRGRHFGERLVDFAMDFARREGLRTSIVCPFARAYLRRHPPSAATR
jgi:predicted GNAT family acetyltransferase